MYYVYVLQSKLTKKLYTGYTSDLKKRIYTHMHKGAYTTKKMGEIELIFYEGFKAKTDAQRREGYLKTSKGKRAVKIMLRDTLNIQDPV